MVLAPGTAPASLIARVSIAAVAAIAPLPTAKIAAADAPSAGNGNSSTVGVTPPAPPTGAASNATTVPTAGPGGISPAPTPLPTAPPILKPSTVNVDNAAFIGAAAANTTRLTLELAAGDLALASKLKIAPGVEIRAKDKLTLASDWNLAPVVSGTRVGEAPVITLRAAGDLLISNSLSDGFAGANAATDKRAIAADGLAQAGSAASFRLIGGADLGAAQPLAVQSGSTAGVTIGRIAATNSATPPIVLVRSTTGSIAIAAASDINLGAALPVPPVPNQPLSTRNSQVRVYTTGEPVSASDVPGLERVGIRATDQLIRNTTGSLGPFFENAGDITLSAGRDVRGLPATIYPASGAPTSVQYVTDWWWRQANPTSVDQGVALWSRYDLFAQGIASFGGGDIAVKAGRDLIDVDLSTPSSGFAVQARDDKPAQQRWFAGGTLDVQAGRDVVGGLFNAGGAKATLKAGGDIRGNVGNPGAAPRSYAAPQIFYADTAWQITAGGALNVGNLTNAAAMSGARQGIDSGPRTDTVLGLADHASARLLSVSGDVRLGDARPTSASGSRPGAGATVTPDELTIAAPGGAISADVLAQRPVGTASLQLLARGGVALDAFQIAAAAPDVGSRPTPVTQAALGEFFNVFEGFWTRSDAGLDASGGSPVMLVSRQADVVLGQLTSFSARPLRLVAGRDLVLGPLQVQHSEATALSLLQAGRDVRVGSTVGGVRLAGPGELVVTAGRDIDLGRGTGIVSVGNLDNARLLPTGGASLLLLAGVQLPELSAAVAGQFQLLGAGLHNFPAELAVQLEALAAGGLLPPARAAQAAAEFAALPLAERTERVRALVGDSFAASTEAYIRQTLALVEAKSEAATAAVVAGRVSGSARDPAKPPVPSSELLGGKPQLVDPLAVPAIDPVAAQASVRAALREALLAQALGAALAAKAQTLDAVTRDALVLAVSPYSTALTTFVNGRTSGTQTAAAAAQTFKTLPAEQQLLFINSVLMAELKSAGRAALSGERVAYLRGYQALDALYPGGDARVGNIVLSNSQVKTSQGGAISFSAPGGTLNVGDLAGGGTAKAASDLGIVTVAGGSINAAVRDSVEVNQSRIFTLGQGDVLLWASLGNLDAGRGAKTVTGAPPPVFSINAQGQFVVDTSGSFSGSGIAVLDAGSTLDLYAALGEINAGDAGIKTAGSAFLGATRLVGGDDVKVGGERTGNDPNPPAPPAPIIVPASATATSSDARDVQKDEDDERKKRRLRRNIFLDFLGFGQGE